MEMKLEPVFSKHTGRKFRTVQIRLTDYDRSFIETLKTKGRIMAEQVNKQAANDAQRTRNQRRIEINCIAGILAEVAWKKCINRYYGEKFVTETEFDKTSNQIDLLLNHSGKTIEVRSSFPKNGLQFALCHPRYQFDVIGPYTNLVKLKEPVKDFYVRTLFPFSVNSFFDELDSGMFVFYLTGGATWAMMADDSVAIEKDFVPDDAVIDKTSSYRVVPFQKALDTIEILEQLRVYREE